MNTRTFVTCLAGFFWLAIGAAVAQQDIPELIEFDGTVDGGDSKDIYRSSYTGPVKFTHAKHVEDYGAVCGDCHHNSDVEPIESYDPDETYECSECHDEEGLIRGPIAENDASDSDLIAHRANAIHMQCIGCHKRNNDKKHLVQAPESCITCHTKHSQDWEIK
jgi:hypothetical protein